MNMAWAASKPELVTKLVKLAGGDIELVHKAIRAVKMDDKPADLEKVVEYIVQHRQPISVREKVA